MSYFVVSPEQQRADAEDRLRTALRLLDAAMKAYDRTGSKANRISLAAATRLVKETTAELEEWMV